MASSLPLRPPQKPLSHHQTQSIRLRNSLPPRLAITPSRSLGDPPTRSTLLGKLKTRKRANESLSVPALSSLTPTSFSIALPIPPSINQQYATVNGRRVLSSRGRRYKTATAQVLLSVLTQSPHRTSFLQAISSHFLALSIHFYFPSLLRRDLDSGLKIAQDALCEALGINDNRIVEIHLYKTLDRDNPRLDCTLSTTNPSPTTTHQRPRSRRTPNRRTNS